MLDIKLIREQTELVKYALVSRHMETGIIDEVIALDEKRRALILDVESKKAERNSVSKEIGRMKDKAEKEAMIASMRALGDQIDSLDEELKGIESNLYFQLATIPNIPNPDVPVGIDDKDNVVIRTVGEKKSFDFDPKPHWDLGPELGIIDFEAGVKLSGSRFYVLEGAGARLQRALIFWMLDLHIRQGYREFYPPWMVREEVMFASGQLPKFEDNLYHDAEEDFWWVPTAEVPLTGIMMGEVVDEANLPLNMTAYTACFRREKMSAGRDVRGMKRGHQFDKVEMYKYCLPENAEQELDSMVADAAATCEGLGLIYRVLLQSTGDLSFGSHKTYDIEVWAPGCQEWLEVSSISNIGQFQARRANIKYRPADGSALQFVNTLNGSGLGLPRTLIAVMENYQQADGSIVIPEVLKPFMGGIEVIRK
ncbi:MAG: serine--tRNA ligase [Anaerolineaceae bacterium]|nr:serine--tRNA ligase [Anaerolineaceae bacterium]MDD4042840.1 serine--tRNA ligase [Anaerolineaceae bacterium]MDD4578680.1 serine--tRNA ligase [Anaerolineaceae bacterium]